MHPKFELYSGLKGLMRRDRTDVKRRLFYDLLKQYPLALTTYQMLERFSFLRRVVGHGYFLFSYFRLSTESTENSQHFALVIMPNEKRALNEVLLPETRMRLRLGRRNISGILKNLAFDARSARSLLARYKQVAQIINRLAVQSELFVGLRAIEYVADYCRLYREFTLSPVKGVLSFTDNNPHGLALLQVAHALSLPATFVSHGEPQPPLYPIRCKRAFLLGAESFKKYQSAGSLIDKVIFRGHRHLLKPMRPLGSRPICRVGVFLSKTSNKDGVVELIGGLIEKFKPREILIRPHPNFKQKFILELSQRHFDNVSVKISQGESVGSDIETCDLVVAGNSTVHLEVLLFGRPSLYAFELEQNHYDRYGYLKEALVLDWKTFDSAAFQAVDDFFAQDRINPLLGQHISIDQDLKSSIEKLNETMA